MRIERLPGYEGLIGQFTADRSTPPSSPRPTRGILACARAARRPGRLRHPCRSSAQPAVLLRPDRAGSEPGQGRRHGPLPPGCGLDLRQQRRARPCACMWRRSTTGRGTSICAKASPSTRRRRRRPYVDHRREQWGVRRVSYALSVLDLSPVSGDGTQAQGCATPSRWPRPPSGWAMSGSGWPSTTMSEPSPPRAGDPDRGPDPGDAAPSAWAPAASCW